MMFVALRGVTYFPQPPTLMAVVSSRNMNVVCSCTDEHAEEEGLKLRQVNISCYMYTFGGAYLIDLKSGWYVLST